MRPPLLVLLALLLGLTIVPYPTPPATASCVGPSLVGHRIVLTHDGEQMVRGRGFHDGCGDSESCTLGCGCEVDDPESPSEDVELRLTQQGRSWTLGMVDADDHDRTTWTFELPSSVAAGSALLLADGVRPERVRIR